MACSTVPKFGNWEIGENVSYSTCFENARRVPSIDKMNTKNSPDDPTFNFKQEALRRAEVTRTKHGHTVSQEDCELRKAIDSPSRHDGGRRTAGNLTPQRPAGISGDAFKRAAGVIGGGTCSAGHSPLHPHYQAKFSTKESVASSPSWEKKTSQEGSHGLAPTPGRSRLRSVPRGSETPDRGASVPKFGEWDETDPSSADGFTHIFNRVKEERHGSIGNKSGTATDSRRSDDQKHHRSNDSKVQGVILLESVMIPTVGSLLRSDDLHDSSQSCRCAVIRKGMVLVANFTYSFLSLFLRAAAAFLGVENDAYDL